jgi:hypothetical protein
MELLEKIKGYKTQVVAILVMLDGVLMAMGLPTPGGVALGECADTATGFVVAAIGAVFMLLRRFTDSGPGAIWPTSG